MYSCSLTCDPVIYQVMINEQWEGEFQYNDPTLEICQGDARQ